MNKRQITKALREAAFTPNKPGPLKIIADVGNTDYYITRAIEFLALSLESPSYDQCTYYLNMALSLIALAKVEINEKTKNKK